MIEGIGVCLQILDVIFLYAHIIFENDSVV